LLDPLAGEYARRVPVVGGFLIATACGHRDTTARTSDESWFPATWHIPQRRAVLQWLEDASAFGELAYHVITSQSRAKDSDRGTGLDLIERHIGGRVAAHVDQARLAGGEIG
jgi:hypothetical protein